MYLYMHACMYAHTYVTSSYIFTLAVGKAATFLERYFLVQRYCFLPMTALTRCGGVSFQQSPMTESVHACARIPVAKVVTINTNITWLQTVF